MSDSPDLHDDAPARRTLFLAAWLLMLVPFVQAASQIWPLQLGNIQWRFGAANALSSVLLLPFLGLSLLLVLARSLERRGLARLVGSLAALFSLGIAGAVVVFVLDAEELKSIVSSQMAGQFTSTTARVALVSVLFVFGFLLLAVFGFASIGHQRKDVARKARRAETEAPDSDSPLIVGR
jgi:cytochrome bd-type quinol oxidase subunit 2